MPDFSVLDPPQSITNPSATSGTTRKYEPYPRCVYRKDRTFIVVQDAAGEAAAEQQFAEEEKAADDAAALKRAADAEQIAQTKATEQALREENEQLKAQLAARRKA